MSHVKDRYSVSVKVRPFIEQDYNTQATMTCVTVSKERKRIILTKDPYEERVFTFDNIYDPSASQEEVFQGLARPILDDAFLGYNGTMLAYGQTGSGKTYTIFGTERSLQQLRAQRIAKETGLVFRSLHYIFEEIYKMLAFRQFQVTISFMQLYNEQVIDMLGDAGSVVSLQIREDPATGIYVQGLTQVSVTNLDDAVRVIDSSVGNRMSASTSLNHTSSRSHAIIQVLLEQRWVETTSVTDGTNPQQVKVKHHKRGLITIVDLAGSERLSKTNSTGQQLKEAKFINKSIAALGNCIQALSHRRQRINNYPPTHIPYRESKLTRLLSESICGFSKTAFCICVSPAYQHYDESFSSLLFGYRAMMIRVDAAQHEDLYYKIIDRADLQLLHPIDEGELLDEQPHEPVPSQVPVPEPVTPPKKQGLPAMTTDYLEVISYLQQKLVKKTLQIATLESKLNEVINRTASN